MLVDIVLIGGYSIWWHLRFITILFGNCKDEIENRYSLVASLIHKYFVWYNEKNDSILKMFTIVYS